MDRSRFADELGTGLLGISSRHRGSEKIRGLSLGQAVKRCMVQSSLANDKPSRAKFIISLHLAISESEN